MKKKFTLLLLSCLLQSCNDGDIIVTTFDFSEASLEACGGVGNYVFFQINSEVKESLSLRLKTNDNIYANTDTLSYTLDGTSNFVNYRTYDSAITNGYFCSSIPPTSPEVTIDYLGAAGTAVLSKVFNYDDGDNVPEEEEFDGDTDIDGLADLIDFDDDGDNVPTARELDTENEDGDDNPFTNPKDTDGDGIADYLDADDDGDGVPTRYEDANADLDPTNDATDPAAGPDYLNKDVAITTVVDEYKEHAYTISKDLNITLKNLVLVNGDEEITEETLSMGIRENAATEEKKITPTL